MAPKLFSYLSCYIAIPESCISSYVITERHHNWKAVMSSYGDRKGEEPDMSMEEQTEHIAIQP
jgi:hypothetical protein